MERSMDVTGEHTSAESVWHGFAEDLAQLAFLHAKEPTAALLSDLRAMGFPETLSVELTSDAARNAKQRFAQGLANLPEEITQSVLDVFAADFADVYLNNTFSATPLESVWIDEDKLALQEPTFQVRKLYQHFNLRATNWRLRSEDHLVAELEFLVFLLQCSGEAELKAAARFLDEHLLRWAPSFLAIEMERASTVFYSALAELSWVYLEELRTLLEKILCESRPSKEEIDARMKSSRLVRIGEGAFVPGCGPTI